MPGPAALLKVKVQPRAARSEVVGWQGDVLRVRVTAPPEGGRANAAVVELVAVALGIAKSRVSIARGQTARDKTLTVAGLTEAELKQRLLPS